MENWIADNIGQLLKLFANSIINYIINPIIEQVGSFFYKCIDYLPTFRVDNLLNTDAFGGQLLSWINWFIPMSALASGVGILVVSWTAYFGIAPLLRWFKFVK